MHFGYFIIRHILQNFFLFLNKVFLLYILTENETIFSEKTIYKTEIMIQLLSYTLIRNLSQIYILNI